MSSLQTVTKLCLSKLYGRCWKHSLSDMCNYRSTFSIATYIPKPLYKHRLSDYAKEIKRCFQFSDMLRGSMAVKLTRFMCWLGAGAGSECPSAFLCTQFATWYKQFCSNLTYSLKQIEKKDFILPSFLMWLAESQNIISSIFHSLWHVMRSFMLLKQLKNKLRREQRVKTDHSKIHLWS